MKPPQKRSLLKHLAIVIALLSMVGLSGCKKEVGAPCKNAEECKDGLKCYENLCLSPATVD